MSDTTKYNLLVWAEWGSKLLLTATAALMWQTYVDVQKMNARQSENERRMTVMEAKQEAFLTRQEAMEMMKRTELMIATLVKDEEIKRLKAQKDRP